MAARSGLFGTRGCRGPACSAATIGHVRLTREAARAACGQALTGSGEAVLELQVARRLELLGDAAASGVRRRRRSPDGGPAGGDDARERRGPEQHVGEVAARRCPCSTWSTIAFSWSGPGGSATPATTRATWARPRPSSNSWAALTGSAYTHGPEDEEPPQAPGQRVGGCTRPRASAMVSMPSVSASRSSRSATALPAAVAGTAHQQRGGAVGGLADQRRVGAAEQVVEEPAARRHRPVVLPSSSGERTSDALVADRGGRAEPAAPTARPGTPPASTAPGAAAPLAAGPRAARRAGGGRPPLQLADPVHQRSGRAPPPGRPRRASRGAAASAVRYVG